MSLDTTTLLTTLRPVLATLVTDLAVRAIDPGVEPALRAEHSAEVEARRTADPYEVWLDFRVVQVAAAWVLSLLFVRTLEDRGLVAARLKDARDHRAQLRSLAPYLNDRDYLLLVFRELTRHRAVKDVFDAAHNPVWTLGPSAEAAAGLVQAFGDPDGLGGMNFSGDTRFLGDVYERLDEGVQKRFALLQTPDFVEAYILDGTLEPALDERGVAGQDGTGLTLIDPTCGSGHFLLGAFRRLVAAWAERAPADPPQVHATRALSQVYGADLNPYAVAIARFRLVLAWLDAAGLDTLDAAQDLPVNVAVADSLLPVEGARQQSLASRAGSGEAQSRWNVNPFTAGQSAEAQRVLGGRTFDVVVGNPPYITVKDKVLRDVYRERYVSAYREYQLVVPFVERFFGLAEGAGWVGAIVGNGFTKREFGKKLIQEFLPRMDLTRVVDTSGAFIPGHGTPTVILFGRNRTPHSNTVVAVMGKRGEPTTPKLPSEGLVWSSIRDHSDDVGFDNEYVSTERIAHLELCRHPWTLRGGGALSLKRHLEQSSQVVLGRLASSIGFMCITKQDEVFAVPQGVLRRAGVAATATKPFVAGQAVRDWSVNDDLECLFPYRLDGETRPLRELGGAETVLMPWRKVLYARKVFGGSDFQSAGKPWWEYGQIPKGRLSIPLSITFAFVATHNHFVLDRGGKVFKRTAPIIKLKEDATVAEHLVLLGYLNSSTACFWMKMVFFCRGAQGVNEGLKSAAWMQFYEHDSTKIKQFPVLSDPTGRIESLSRAIDALATNRAAESIARVIARANWTDSRSLHAALANRRTHQDGALAQMVALQENLDWCVYADFGLCDVALANETSSERLPCGRLVDLLTLQEARKGFDDAAAWFRVHGWEFDSVVAHWERNELSPVDQRRLAAIESSRELRLLESPEFKRRWYRPDHDAQEKAALQTFLLDHLESTLQTHGPTPTSIRRLARTLAGDPKVMAVAQVLTDTPDPDLEAVLTDLAAKEAVPHLAALRYKPSGMKKFHAWQCTWGAQRAEDAWEAQPAGTRGPRPPVPLPPKYGSGDFLRAEYWSRRGKLDVPKERFIAYPGAEDPDEKSPVLGWAGWDHADRMAALAELLERHKGEPDRETPLLAGMVELLPWVQQWHGDDTRYGTPLGPMWAQHIEGERTRLGLSQDALRDWRPPKKTGGRGRKPGKPKAPPLTRERLEAALVAVLADDAVDTAAGVERRVLQSSLGTTAAAVGKAMQPLLDDGAWEVIKKRPMVYAPAPGRLPLA
jgi:hypothetical protein